MSKSVVCHRVATSNLLEHANKNRNEGYFNDFTIIAGNKMIYANRLVLSCYSKFFEKRLKSELYRNENIIEIEEVDGATMKALIDFIYCGSININDQNVMNLLKGADDLQLEEVKDFCFEFLEANEIVLDNSLDIFKMVFEHKESILHKKIKHYISINFSKVFKTKKYEGLSKKDLISCISIVDRLHANEESIYQAVVTWTRHNEEARAPEFPELFKMINLSHMSIEFLEKIIVHESLFANNPQCRKEALAAYKRLTLEQTEQSRAKETHLISLGGFLTSQNVTVVFNLSQETSKDYPNFDEDISVYCCLKLNDYIYVIGKQRRTSLFWLNSKIIILKLNLKKQNGKWKRVTSLNKNKTFLCANVFYGTLFVAGGRYKNLVTALSEYYDPAKIKWISGPQLNQARSNHCLVACDGCLYALGGIVERKVSSSVEMLEDLKGTWQNIQPMQTPRCMFAAVNCNEVVYVVGGTEKCFEMEQLKSVEKYNRNTSCWTYVADMNIARSDHAACVLRGKIYVIGGFGADGTPVKEIECYDSAIDEWRVIGTVTDNLACHTLIAV